MIEPPGLLLRRLIDSWPAERRARFGRDFALSAADFEMLLLGARPLGERQIIVAADALGVPAAKLREAEAAFGEWAGFIGHLPREAVGTGNDRGIRRLFSAAEIARRVAALALEMADLPRDELVLVPILKGAFIFAADLLRFLFALGTDPLLEFVEISSYRQSRDRTATVAVSALPAAAVAGRTVLLVDDICDSALTFDDLKKAALSQGAARVLTCALIDKTERRDPRLADYRPDYVGFTVAGGWIVGYGMDDRGRLRGSPEVGELPIG